MLPSFPFDKLSGSNYSLLILLFYFLIAVLFCLLGILFYYLYRRKNNSLSLFGVSSAALLNNILESSIEYSIIVLDLKGQILTWNTGARNSYGFEPREMLGKNIKQLHISEDLK